MKEYIENRVEDLNKINKMYRDMREGTENADYIQQITDRIISNEKALYNLGLFRKSYIGRV